ncbi:hypothetical protein EYF80_058971 [Liparis tanakae]|uniref:Uncharacterized protein n=1 Tax=Liparis tanakae TaxID=230148 RepID=A0A4Z2EPP4_9TELE|nr:hypothetical protein EYF80_058971 [Liparis tanakae]
MAISLCFLSPIECPVVLVRFCTLRRLHKVLQPRRGVHPALDGRRGPVGVPKRKPVLHALATGGGLAEVEHGFQLLAVEAAVTKGLGLRLLAEAAGQEVQEVEEVRWPPLWGDVDRQLEHQPQWWGEQLLVGPGSGSRLAKSCPSRTTVSRSATATPTRHRASFSTCWYPEGRRTIHREALRTEGKDKGQRITYLLRGGDLEVG